jgi:hypothetical protein
MGLIRSWRKFWRVEIVLHTYIYYMLFIFCKTAPRDGGGTTDARAEGRRSTAGRQERRAATLEKGACASATLRCVMRVPYWYK